jgi:hypothetical protein
VSVHVPVEPSLRLDPGFAYVEDYLRVADPLLRLRKSASSPGFFILERRCQRSKPVHTSRRDLNDGQVSARDGYMHVATVHRYFLDRPARIIESLHEQGADLHKPGGYRKLDRDLRQADEDARTERRMKRRQMFEDIAADSHDAQARLGTLDGFRTRINNAGTSPHSSTGESPVGEMTDEHSPFPPHAAQDGGVSGQSAVR